MPITASNWKRLSPLLDEALDLPPAQRVAWLAALAPEHADLRESLAELLSRRQAIETDDFLNRLPAFSGPPPGTGLSPGGQVGPYRLLRELGTGGTASVWLAELADGSIQRKVALKLPHLGLVGRDIAERIARERDILAGLEHPNIARLYDAGLDERGRPFLALEYVDGVPPDEYCSTEKLNLRQKLALFIQILRAVSFAHARLVVHRDLKPNNILIRDDGQVRLLDFGIARLLRPDSPARAQHTVVGAAALTPAYAAPEQFTGQAVTVATDVYSLGVILFELLTGMSPYSPEGRSLGAYEHEVLHVEPPLLSRAARAAESGALKGDLEAIVAKALEKKPGDRYASVEAFANDIERHLAAEPIMARRRSFGYVSRKFLRRNLLPVSLGVAVMVVLTGALASAAWQWRDAERQREIAMKRLGDSRAAEEFTSTVLIENIQPGQSLTFDQLIERSEQIARDTGAKDLRTRIFATDFLSNWYEVNGLYRNAEVVLTRTIDSLPANEPLVGATLRCRRARVWHDLGDRNDSVAVLDDLIARTDVDDAIVSRCLLDRSSVAASNADAPGALRFALEAQRRYNLSGVESIFDRADILTSIGGAYGILGDFGPANENYAQTLRLFEEAGRGRSRAAAVLHDDWATIWMNAGNPRRALQEIDLGWSIFRELAPAAQDADKRLARRARILAQIGDLDAALADFQRAGAAAEARGNLANVVAIQIGEADVWIQKRELHKAGARLDAAASNLRQGKFSNTSLIGVRFVLTRAEWLAARGDRDAARASLAQVLELYASQKCCRATRAFALSRRAELALDAGDAVSAEADIQLAVELAPSRDAESFSRFTAGAWSATGRLREAQGRLREARDAYAIAAVQYAGSVGEGHPDTVRAREAIARTSTMLTTKNHN